MTVNKQWLPHIQYSIPKDVTGYTLSSYCTVLEAWRRGITVKFINKNRRRSELIYSLSYGGKEHKFTVAKGDLVTKETIHICKSKNITKKYLSKANVPVPEGKLFGNDVNDNDIIHYAETLSFPVVIKPADGTAGAGVISNIKNKQEFKEALKYVKYELNFSQLIVEKFIEGEDYRLYVIDGKVIGGIHRLAANVIGDGRSTIQTLINNKIKERNKNPSLVGRPIKVDNELRNMLKQVGYTLNSIPKKDQMVFLKSKNNVSAGGESIDVTDELTEEVKKVAVDAANAIPGLVQCGVDLMVNTKTNTAVVIELNSMPHITAQLFPWKGKARDIPKAIIDFYFPETKSNDSLPAYYFEFSSIWNVFRDGVVKEYLLPNIPTGDLAATVFIISGKVQRVNYGIWIRRKARDLDLNGYVKHLKNGKTSIVISGSSQSIDKFRSIIKEQTSKQAKVTNIVEKSRKRPVKVGFEIMNPELDRKLKEGYYPVRVEGIKSHLNTRKRKSQNAKIKNEEYKKEYYKIINSTSWKITKPLRKIGKIFK